MMLVIIGSKTSTLTFRKVVGIGLSWKVVDFVLITIFFISAGVAVVKLSKTGEAGEKSMIGCDGVGVGRELSRRVQIFTILSLKVTKMIS